MIDSISSADDDQLWIPCYKEGFIYHMGGIKMHSNYVHSRSFVGKLEQHSLFTTLTARSLIPSAKSQNINSTDPSTTRNIGIPIDFKYSEAHKLSNLCSFAYTWGDDVIAHPYVLAQNSKDIRRKYHDRDRSKWYPGDMCKNFGILQVTIQNA